MPYVIESEKDVIALTELSTIITRLTGIHHEAQEKVGKSRPILPATEIELIKDHLDLVVKYTKL